MAEHTPTPTPVLPSVEESTVALVWALVRAKGWSFDYADSIVRDAIDRKHLESEGLKVVAWKCDNEFAPYHPDASHCSPDYRNGWNACYRAAQAALSAQAAEKDAVIAALKADVERLDWVIRQADEFSCGVIVDAPGDGDYLVHGMDRSGQGKTARAAIDQARGAVQLGGTAE